MKTKKTLRTPNIYLREMNFFGNGSSSDEPFPKKQKVNVTTRSSTSVFDKFANKFV